MGSHQALAMTYRPPADQASERDSNEASGADSAP